MENLTLFLTKDFAHSRSGAFFMGNFTNLFEEPSSNTCGRNIMGKVILNYSSINGIEQLTWDRTDIHWGANCYPWDETPFKVPAHMVLTKIN